MQPDIRRIVAVDAHRRRTGRCPETIHSLGSGESFGIAPALDGFTDLESGLRVRVDGRHILLPYGAAPIEIALDGDVAFTGFDPASGERFTGRAGGGSSVTIYDSRQDDYFQYAVVNDSGI
jgi:hypothetical protein